jgi:RNA polymerase primary sigma factor
MAGPDSSLACYPAQPKTKPKAMKSKLNNAVPGWTKVRSNRTTSRRSLTVVKASKRAARAISTQPQMPKLPKLLRSRRGLGAELQAPPKPAPPARREELFSIPPISQLPVQASESVAPDRDRWDSEASSALTLYMREVGAVPLLTPEQEVELAKRVKAGDEQAREHMIRANLRLVVKIAREYENLGLPLLDLINEGNIGLMRAVERFDPSKGAKLSSYSSWWIRQSIRRALANQAKTIRLPVNAVDQICHLKKAATRLREVLGREPNELELASELGLTVRRVGELREAALRPASLDAPLSDEDSSTLMEVVPDERAEDPYQVLEDRNSLSVLGSLVDRLPERERKIIRLRFGLDGGRQLTLEEIGAKFNLTRERIRQLQNLALHKLRRMLEEPEAIQVVA